MNQKYVTSLELSKRLKEAGVKQESEWYWYMVEAFPEKGKYLSIEYVLSSNTPNDLGKITRICSAFSVGELGEMLPAMCVTTRKSKMFMSGHICSFEPRGTKWDKYAAMHFDESTEAEARGKMVLYLKENELI